MIKNTLSLAAILGSVMGCQSLQTQPMSYPDQSGNKKGPGLLSTHDEGFIVYGADLVKAIKNDIPEAKAAKPVQDKDFKEHDNKALTKPPYLP